MLYADVIMKFQRVRGDNGTVINSDRYREFLNISTDETSEMGVSETNHYTSEAVYKVFHKVPLGRIPVMLHSNICCLHSQDANTLKEMGECPHGQGGYFIVKGKEKAIIAQERQMENVIFIDKGKTDHPYRYQLEVRSSPEEKFQPARVTKLWATHAAALRPNRMNGYLFDLLRKTKVLVGVGSEVNIIEGDPGKVVGKQGPHLWKVQTVSGETHLCHDNQLQVLRNSRAELRDNAIYCGRDKPGTDSVADRQYQVKQDTIRVYLPNCSREVPLFILFRALGVESDRDIMSMIIHDVDDRNKLGEKFAEILRPTIREAQAIQSQEEAILVLDCLMKEVRLETRLGQNYQPLARNDSGRMAVVDNLVNYFVPHIGESLRQKAHYLGHMTHRLLSVMSGIEHPTERDSYLQKRVDISGFLIAQLFRDLYFRLKNEIIHTTNIHFSGVHKSAEENNTNIHYENEISLDTIRNFITWRKIDDGMLYAFRNCWGMERAPCREGVVQDLSIASNFGTVSHLRRINTPLPKSAKMREPHSLHGSSWGIMCPTETPDGGNVGIRKNLAIQAQITFGSESYPLRSCLRDLGCLDIDSVPATQLVSYAKVFLNGRIHGINSHPDQLADTLRVYRRNGLINIYTSISWNRARNEVSISTESGRGTRPVFVVATYPDRHLPLTETWTQRIARNTVTIRLDYGDGHSQYREMPREQWNTVLTSVKTESADVTTILLESTVTNPETNQITDAIPLAQLLATGEASSKCTRIIVDSRTGWQRLLTGYQRFEPSVPVFTTHESGILVEEAVLQLNDSRYHCSELPLTALRENSGIIEYLDVMESNQTLIAMSDQDLTTKLNYPTHCEIDPAMILGVVSSIIPFIGSNQAPRNIFSNAQTKQGVGIFATNFRNRMDNKSQILLYPQAPLVDTRVGKYLKTDKLPYGLNAIIAIACYSGYNQDDSIIINRSSLDRGMFRSLKYRTYSETEQTLAQGHRQYFARPDPDKVTNITPGNYSKLDEFGFVREGEYVTENDVIIGICVEEGGRDGDIIDNSVFIKRNESGVVDRVYVGTDVEGNRLCKVRIRKDKTPVLGDKFASRHGGFVITVS